MEKEYKLKFKGGHFLKALDLNDVQLLKAAVWVNEGRTTFRGSDEAWELMADRWDTHPDRKIILSWLETKGAESDYGVIVLVSAHVISEWLSLRKRTPKEHQKLFKSIEVTAQNLIDLLTETGELYYRGGGHGLQGASVCDLFNDSESRDIMTPLKSWCEANPVVMDDGDTMVENPSNLFPKMEDLLLRLSFAARRITADGPIHSQPNKRGAINGYFVRRMEGLLIRRYGEAPSEVLAAIATIALDVVMDYDLAKKNVNLKERSSTKKKNNVQT